MAKKKVTITLDTDKVTAIEDILKSSPSGSISGWIEDAVSAKLDQAERAARALDWLVERARQENPGEWEKALAAVEDADRRRGHTGPGQEQSAA
ncbi:hypothetical protein ACGFZK_07785 [Streptomyces sp. NPDC048257]|uniref:hypothetical protein n=1 Tax=Streptomyces sp. NPDC048257 TaxID=3365526 RepID=UPI003717052E